MESDETWLTETLYDDVRMSIKVDRVLFDSQKRPRMQRRR
jgi:hypothetical protein